MPSESYSVRRKADRAVMAARLAQVWTERGANVTIALEAGAKARSVTVTLDLGDYAARVSFDGTSRAADAATFVVPWHSKTTTARKLNDLFGLVAGGTVNQHHRQKCTAVCIGFDDLLARCGDAATLLQTGDAFHGAS